MYTSDLRLILAKHRGNGMAATVTRLKTGSKVVEALGDIMKDGGAEKDLAVLVMAMLGKATVVKQLSLANYIKLGEMVRIWTGVYGSNPRIDFQFREAREIATWLNSL